MHTRNDTTSPQGPGDPRLLHQINNFLTLCMTHAEVALETRTPEDAELALGRILEGARETARSLRNRTPAEVIS